MSTGQRHDPTTAAPSAHPAVDALDRLDVAVVSVDRHASIRHANAFACGLIGRSLADVVGRNLFGMMPYLREAEFSDHFDRALTSGEDQEYETFAPRVGRWMRRRLFPTPDGVVVVADEGRTARQGDDEAAQASLSRARDTERRFQEILALMNEGVTETTADGHFVVVNESFATMLGYEDADDLLAHVPTSTALYLRPDLRPVMIEALAAGSTRTVETQLRHRDGHGVWVRVRVTPRLAADGTPLSFRCFTEDITAEHEAEQARREAETHIEARERAALAEAIHDEPLQLVVASMLHLDTIRGRVPADVAPSVDHVTELLDRTVDRLRNLIVALDPPDLRHGLGPAVHAVADGIFMGSTTTVEVLGPSHVPLSPDVASEAYRVLREALVNARKHASARHVVVALVVADGEVVLSVSDDGVGGAAPTTEPGHLGLTSMRTRVESLDGSLRVVSPPGEGTRVVLTFPARPAP